MKQKKKGFTLTEVMVVILVSTLVLAMVGGTMIFITTTTSELIQEAEEIEMAKNIEKYLRSLPRADNYYIERAVAFDKKTGNIKNRKEEIIFSNTGLIEFIMGPEYVDGFMKCYMKFQSGKVFEFIIRVESDS